MIVSISPVAAQVGQTTECQVTGLRNLGGAYQVFVSGHGVTGEVVGGAEIVPETEMLAKTTTGKPADKKAPPKPPVEKVKVRFTVAADATPGVREVRLATPQGASTVGTLVVTREPIVRESGDNDTLEKAQAITLPATIGGELEKVEDVDFYKFTISQPGGWTFHVQSARLQDKIHDLQAHSDPIIMLRAASGTVLASSDNYFAGDPLLFYKIAHPGEYYLEVRDVRYQGNKNWQYAIEVSQRPFVTAFFPPRALPGASIDLQLLGFNLPENATWPLALPEATPECTLVVAPSLAGQPLNGVPLCVSRLPDVRETAADNNTPAKAQPIAIPAGVSGCLEAEGDFDCYSFEAKKGETFSFEVVARRVQSGLDANLRILSENGDRKVENDDLTEGRSASSDSRLETWAAPADGRYVVEVRDLHLRGGANYVYLLKAERSQPYFYLEIDTDKTLLTPGASGVMYVRVARRNGFTGEIKLDIDGLPPGVSASCGRILQTGVDGCIMLTAEADALPIAANVRVTGRGCHTHPDGLGPMLEATAHPLQETYMPGGGRGHYPVSTHTVSVTEAAELLGVKLSENEIVLKPGESKKIDVTIERREGFDGNVSIDVIYRHLASSFGNSLPPGVTLDEKKSQLRLAGKQTQGSIILVAAADAKPIDRQLVPVMAHLAINFVMKYTLCGEPLHVTVTGK